MKVKCDFCNKTASGNIDSLTDKGWQRAVFFKPIRKTITCCPEHSKEGCAEIQKILAGGDPAMIAAAMPIPPMSAEAVIEVLQARCDELLDVVAKKDRTIALQVDLIASSQKAIKIEPGDIERLSNLAMLLRSDTRPFFGAYIDSLERVLAGVREA